MDGGDALPDPKARRGERRDELECARLQLETGHESHRCQRFDEGAVELKKRRFWPIQEAVKQRWRTPGRYRCKP